MSTTFILATLFASIGFMVSKSNARYLLSGYNTMSEADRAQVDIDAYLKLFRRFHIGLGLSLLLLGGLARIFSRNVSDVLLITIPLVAYAGFSVVAERYFKPKKIGKMFSRGISVFLVVVALVIGYMAFISFRDAGISWTADKLEISGVYGVELNKADILSVESRPQVPAISSRSNGFNGGAYRKGSFRLQGGQKAKLFLNLEKDNCIVLHTKTGAIYFNSQSVSTDSLTTALQNWLRS